MVRIKYGHNICQRINTLNAILTSVINNEQFWLKTKLKHPMFSNTNNVASIGAFPNLPIQNRNINIKLMIFCKKSKMQSCMKINSHCDLVYISQYWIPFIKQQLPMSTIELNMGLCTYWHKYLSINLISCLRSLWGIDSSNNSLVMMQCYDVFTNTQLIIQKRI